MNLNYIPAFIVPMSLGLLMIWISQFIEKEFAQLFGAVIILSIAGAALLSHYFFVEFPSMRKPGQKRLDEFKK